MAEPIALVLLLTLVTPQRIREPALFAKDLSCQIVGAGSRHRLGAPPVDEICAPAQDRPLGRALGAPA
jgi:hypothetical protein